MKYEYLLVDLHGNDRSNQENVINGYAKGGYRVKSIIPIKENSGFTVVFEREAPLEKVKNGVRALIAA